MKPATPSRRRCLQLGAGAAGLALTSTSLTAAAMNSAAPLPTAITHLDWTRQATIYEVNLRQYTQEGTIRAFMQHLPRLQRMGVGILWLMPLQPIGVKERKGTLGSYYAIRDYTAVNPEFGTLDDLQALVKDAHARGMKVILDWVANHTAWDHAWTTAHKDWYKLNAQGEIYPVTFNEGTPDVEYWTDVVALDYRSEGLRQAMIEAMAFWVREADLDGFRCDVAGLVPVDFWDRARATLDALKPMFMLAEWSDPALHRGAFDMSYGWDLADLFKAVGKGKADARDFHAWFQTLPPATGPQAFPAHAYRMRFTNNHDFNSWHGTDRELYGEAWQALVVLSFTLPGMPLIYSGQEAQLDKRLAFFEKDAIAWGDVPLERFYTELVALKRAHPALAAGQYGGRLMPLATGNDRVLAFARVLDGDAVTVVVNLSGQPQRYTLAGAAEHALAAWHWRVDAPAPVSSLTGR